MGNNQSLHECEECANKSARLEGKIQRFCRWVGRVAPSGLWNFKARLPAALPLTTWRRTMGTKGGKLAADGSVLQGRLTRTHWKMIVLGNWADTHLGIKTGAVRIMNSGPEAPPPITKTTGKIWQNWKNDEQHTPTPWHGQPPGLSTQAAMAAGEAPARRHFPNCTRLAGSSKPRQGPAGTIKTLDELEDLPRRR